MEKIVNNGFPIKLETRLVSISETRLLRNQANVMTPVRPEWKAGRGSCRKNRELHLRVLQGSRVMNERQMFSFPTHQTQSRTTEEFAP